MTAIATATATATEDKKVNDKDAMAASVKDGGDSSSIKDPSASASASETNPQPTSQAQTTGSSFSEMGEGETYEEAGWMAEHRMGCPVGGSWKGYFENVSRRKDRMTSRVQEKFHLFFNATPPPNARIAFDLDGTAESCEEKVGQKDGEESSEKGTGGSKPVDPGALPPGFLHVRGAGENQFGTFEIVGGYEPETGILTVQRVYVLTTDGASEGTKKKNTKSTSTSSAAPVRKSYFTRKRPVVSFKKSGRGGGAAGVGRPSAGPGDGTNAANTAGGSKKTISSAKKRPRAMSELASPSQLPAEVGAIPGAGRRRSTSNVTLSLSLPGMVAAAPLAALPSAAIESATAKSQPLRIQSPQLTPKPGGSASTGRRSSPNRTLSTPTSRKSKSPGVSKSTSRLTIPKAGNPLDARWRSAHFLYYHRQTEVQSDGQPSSSPSTLNSNPTPVTPTNAKTSFVVYEGEMNEGNNIRDGRGVCLFNNDRVYEGQWKRNKEHGQGALLTADRSRTIYIGDWERGKMHGRGTYYYHMYATIIEEGVDPIKGGVYSGEFKENARYGVGTYNLPDGSMYDGEWRDDEPCGKGTFKWSDGSLYNGHWKNGKRNGWGTLNSTDGFSYEGMWVNNAMEGKGSATYPNGQTYDGSWLNGQRDGRGTIVFGNGAVYKGRFKEDNMEGQGTLRMEHNVAVPLPPRPEVKADVLSIADGNPKTPVLVTSPSQTESKDITTNATPALSKNQDQQTKDIEMKDADSDSQTAEGKEEKKNDKVIKTEQSDWMIPIEFQSDIGHIHQKAGFTTGGE
uniref:MORN repeat-containing protein 5 n=1 Tax=Chaetoceros debilis TaxID=122233 RepID=A0A7S3VDB6_9STRA